MCADKRRTLWNMNTKRQLRYKQQWQPPPQIPPPTLPLPLFQSSGSATDCVHRPNILFHFIQIMVISRFLEREEHFCERRPSLQCCVRATKSHIRHSTDLFIGMKGDTKQNRLPSNHVCCHGDAWQQTTSRKYPGWQSGRAISKCSCFSIGVCEQRSDSRRNFCSAAIPL